ncbi:hypothetical protein FB566_1046 [Stackebrandtia endophytica]|uniref:Uncharacterized protein n=1 Tax=Stackebrandtia endophytica TaxID=1496996 RepID=A0A543ASI2_9ACTN|nr:hypothetical protein [Stackebrandtia endophytica]TQL75539.1 hypothetical protein FB566_1046 [Stackebrandtia endophytica]
MTYAPRKLLDAREYIIAKYGVPANAVGIVGGPDHQGGYHCGADRTVNNDYSVVESDRDRKGLTDAAAALDIGTFSKKVGSRTINLRKFSVWLVKQCRAGTADTKDIREVIYTENGSTVKRWDRLGIRSGGDDSHLWHTHISYFRDSEKRDKTALFKRYLEGDVSAKDVWNGYFIDKIDQDSGSSPRMRPESYLAWNHEYAKQQLAQGREILANQTAMMAAIKGAKPEEIQTAVRTELDRAAETDRTERATERTELVSPIADAILRLDDSLDRSKVEEAIRKGLEQTS